MLQFQHCTKCPVEAGVPDRSPPPPRALGWSQSHSVLPETVQPSKPSPAAKSPENDLLASERAYLRWKNAWGFPYHFLPEISPRGGQIGRSRGTKRLKLRKTLHLADTIGGGKPIQENPPPGTTIIRVSLLESTLPLPYRKYPLRSTSPALDSPRGPSLNFIAVEVPSNEQHRSGSWWFC